MNRYIYTTRPQRKGFLGIKAYGKMLLASILLTALVITGMCIVGLIRSDEVEPATATLTTTKSHQEAPPIMVDEVTDKPKSFESLTKNFESDSRYLASLSSRGSAKRTRPILNYDKLKCPTYLVQLMETMSAKHGFPTIATVYCIAEYESKFDPTCWTTKGEDSRGLLQVNVACRAHAKKNPNKTKLFDPSYNLDYQLEELKEYYDQGKKKGLSGADLIIYVSKYGQRPKWNEWIADRIRASYKEYLGAVISDGGK